MSQQISLSSTFSFPLPLSSWCSGVELKMQHATTSFLKKKKKTFSPVSKLCGTLARR